MERVFKHKDKEITTRVRINASYTEKTVESSYSYVERTVRTYLHVVECLIDKKVVAERTCEDHQLEATIKIVEDSAKSWIDNQQPRVDPNVEKLKKMGFV